MSLDIDLSLLLLWAVTDSDSNSTERMSALKANDGWCYVSESALCYTYRQASASAVLLGAPPTYFVHVSLL